MAKEASIVPTRALPPELGGKQPGDEIDVNPPENVIYEPMGLAAKQSGPDEWTVQYLISPFKMVTIKMPGEAKAMLISQLTGGLVLPS